jgi:hypothetical protein
VNRGLAKGVTSAFLSCWNENDYPLAIASAPESQLELRRFWSETLHVLRKDMQIGLIVGGNWRFWGERDLAAVASGCGIPFVVLHKECFKTAAQTKNALDAYRKAGRFEGSHVLTYNAHEKGLFIEAGVAEEDRIIVTGAPRFDALHELRRARAADIQSRDEELPKLVCFAVSPHAGLALDPASGVGVPASAPSSWLDVCEDSLNVWCKVARLRPNVSLIVKVKVGDLNVRPVQNWWSRCDVPSNMKLEIGGVATRVLTDAKAACGFNTTAILDALACGLPVGVVRYASAGHVSSDFLHDYAGLGTPLTDLESTLSWVDEFVVPHSRVKHDLDKPTRHLLEDYVGNADGCAGSRVRAAFLQIMRLKVDQAHRAEG